MPYHSKQLDHSSAENNNCSIQIHNSSTNARGTRSSTTPNRPLKLQQPSLTSKPTIQQAAAAASEQPRELYIHIIRHYKGGKLFSFDIAAISVVLQTIDNTCSDVISSE